MNHHTAGVRLRGGLSLFARVAGWLIVPLYIAGACTSYLLERRTGLPPNEHPMEDVALQVGFGAFAVVGALVVAKRPTNLIGWIMATIALIVAIFPVGDAYAAYVMVTRGHPDALAVLGAWVQSWYWLLLLALTFVYFPFSSRMVAFLLADCSRLPLCRGSRPWARLSSGRSPTP